MSAPSASPVGNSSRKATLLTALLGSLPLSIGIKIRAAAYRSFLGSAGDGLRIHPQVELIGAGAIHLGEQAQLWRNVALNCWTPGSRIVIGDRAVIDRGVYLQGLGGEILIGAGSYVGPYVCMAGPGNVHIGENCLIASHTTLYANNHVFSDTDTPINQQSLDFRGIHIGDDCWLGSGVRVMDGVRIGNGCVVGAGAVVTRDLEDYAVAVGVPARIIDSRRP